MAELPFGEIYEVGGSLRDELLGRAPKDVDFLVRGHDIEELLALCRAVRQGRGAARRGTARRRALLAAVGAARGHRGRAAAARDADRARASRATPATRTPTSASSPTPSCPCATISSAATSPSTRWRATSAAASGSTRSAGATTSRARRAARGARDGVPRRPAAHPARRRALQPRRARSPMPRTRALMTRGGAAHRRAVGRARARGARADARRRRRRRRAAARARRRRARGRAARVGAVHRRDQHSATQAYTLDEHILHVLDAAVHDGAARASCASRRSGTTSASRSPPARASTPRTGARIARRALRRLTYDNDTVATVDDARARALLRRGSRAVRARRARFLARVGRELAPDLLALRRWDRLGRGVEIPAEQVAARERFEQLVEEEWGSRSRSASSRCAATT